MSKKPIFFILIFVILFIVIYFTFYNLLLLDVTTLKYDFRVSDHIGFNADTDFLHFGSVLSGSFAKRSFTVSNIKCRLCKVSIKVKGDNKNWISLTDNSFNIYGNETKAVLATLNVPADAKPGNYSGYFMIYFWKVI